ncbi:hypothetical protein V6N11_067099 [Hibiscus sabdariffa]|uniref:G domain-containing protein n=1 Tax=Hibiscus sabdariffa TaxID=183260 RepID=A0ABR2SQI4_9ROSI
MATSSVASKIAMKIGVAVQKAARRNKGWWYDPHMAAATSAIAQRLPLVDLVAEIRDARVPLSSEYELLKNFPSLSRRIVVMNKMDLADQTLVKGWMRYFEQQSCIPYGVNSHNKDSVKGLLNFIQAQVRGLCKANHHSSETITVMLVGIPNVGKSALANSLHQIGRVSAAEKGKLKHATVSPQPGETKDISSLKVYMPPCSLTGAIRDGLVEQRELAQYFLTILNLSNQYKKWVKYSTSQSRLNHKEDTSVNSKLDTRQKRQYLTDHTQSWSRTETLLMYEENDMMLDLLMQDLMVHDVRGAIFDTISSFHGNLELEDDMMELIEAQMVALTAAFRVPEEGENVESKVGVKLLDLYRTGRLGHYTLDPLPVTFYDPL